MSCVDNESDDGAWKAYIESVSEWIGMQVLDLDDEEE